MDSSNNCMFRINNLIGKAYLFPGGIDMLYHIIWNLEPHSKN